MKRSKDLSSGAQADQALTRNRKPKETAHREKKKKDAEREPYLKRVRFR